MKKYILALLFALTFGLFISHKTYAVSDIVFEPSATDSYSNYSDVFSNCNTYACLSQYKYLIIDIPDNIYMAKYLSLYFYNTRTGSSGRVSSFSYSQPQYIIDLGERSSSAFQIYWSGSDQFYIDDIKLTLTESIGGGSTPTPEPEPCPDPEENSQFIQVVIDAFWKYHTVFAGCVAALIAIFVLYRIIKGAFR